jgi:hypothetical protein
VADVTVSISVVTTILLIQKFGATWNVVLIGFIAYPILWIYGIYDAYKTADRINRGQVRT